MNSDRPHRRLNPMTGEWVLVSPQRSERPWLGQVEKMVEAKLPAYDPNCYLCPGNQRSTGKVNPVYMGIYVFENDFPALLPPERELPQSTSGLFTSEPEVGFCRVVCFSPRHDLTLPELTGGEIENVISAWIEQTRELGGRKGIGYVQVFENKGALMGCSNPHPHSQIWATGQIPNLPALELGKMQDYRGKHGNCLLCDYVSDEQSAKIRIVARNDHFTALVPYWAMWPFEVLLIANRHCGSLTELIQEEVSSLATVMKEITTRYDNLFEVSFPYSMGFHQTPTDGREYPAQHLHAHFYPPLLRSATVRKFMVGYELLSMPQRDLTPESAAHRLRGVSGTHYKQR